MHLALSIVKSVAVRVLGGKPPHRPPGSIHQAQTFCESVRLSAEVTRVILKRAPYRHFQHRCTAQETPPASCGYQDPQGDPSMHPNLTDTGLGVQPLLNFHRLPGPQNLLLPLGPQSLLGMGVALPGPGSCVRSSLSQREPHPAAWQGWGHSREDTRQETDL